MHISDKIKILERSIVEIKKSIPDSLLKDCNHIDNPREYYCYWVLRDIEWSIDILSKITSQESKCKNTIKGLDYLPYADAVTIDTWRRKIYEHVVCLYKFQNINDWAHFRLYLLYWLLAIKLANSVSIDNYFELSDSNLISLWISDILLSIIYFSEVTDMDLWFLDSSIKSVASFNPKNRYLKSTERILKELLRNNELSFRDTYIFWMQNHYWKISNTLHWNPLFAYNSFDWVTRIMENENIFINQIIFAISSLYKILWRTLSSDLMDITIDEQSAETTINSLYFRKFEVWDKVKNWVNFKDWEVLWLFKETSRGLVYNVMIDSLIFRIPWYHLIRLPMDWTVIHF